MISISQTLVGVMMAGVISWGFLRAEQPSCTPEPRRIGYVTLRPLNESAAAMVPITALKDGLGDLGYIEGRDYVFEVRTANNDPTRYSKLTAELTKLPVKLIVAASTPAAVAIHNANPTMPIVVRGPISSAQAWPAVPAVPEESQPELTNWHRAFLT